MDETVAVGGDVSLGDDEPEAPPAGDAPEDVPDDAPADTAVTYCFISEDTLIAELVLQDGEEIAPPEDPILPEGMAFAGWFLEDGTPLFVDEDHSAHADPLCPFVNVIAGFEAIADEVEEVEEVDESDMPSPSGEGGAAQSAVTEEVETPDDTDNEGENEEDTTSDGEPAERFATPSVAPEGEVIKDTPVEEEPTKEEPIEDKPTEEEPTEEEPTTPEPIEPEKPEEPLPFDQSAELYGVIVRVQADAGAFPNDAVLSVTRVLLFEQNQADAAVEEARDEGVNVAARYTFDIKVLDAEGNELQPADGFAVNVSFSLAEAADENLEASVYHIEEEIGGMTAEKLETDVADDTVTAISDGFSLYTVEFTYNALEYVLTGGDSVALDDVLCAVGLTGVATDASVSDESLFSVSRDETGAWRIYSHMPFGSVEWMTVIIDGIEYKIIVTDDDYAENVPFLDENGKGATCDKAIKVTSNQSEWISGWYAVTTNTEISSDRVTVSGDVNLILCDGATLTAVNGIQVTDSDSLTIWAQRKESSGETNVGKLIASGSEGNAAIGGNKSESGGRITINGGEITATSTDSTWKSGAGIGGGIYGSGGTINISGSANVTATGGEDGVGIGGGDNGSGGTINISGSADVKATGGSLGAGIGGGGWGSGNENNGSGGTINISGSAKVTATGGNYGAGIGGGNNGSGGSVSISGSADVTASSILGAGIGGGDNGSGSAVTISGGKVKAISKGMGAGIGGGEDGAGASVTITGGSVTAEVTDQAYPGQPIGRGYTGDNSPPSSGALALSGMRGYTSETGEPIKGKGLPEACRTGTYIRLEECKDSIHEGEGCEYCTISDALGYLDERGRLGRIVDCIDIKDVQNGLLSTGWYMVNDVYEYKSRITVEGDVNLVLCEDARLTVSNTYFTVNEGNSLTIYAGKHGATTAQDITGSGMLMVKAPFNSTDAAIGGSDNKHSGLITINGGTVSAFSESGAAIGGCQGYDGHVVIRGGDVTAVSNSNGGTGIGAGPRGKNYESTIVLDWIADKDGYPRKQRIAADSYLGNVTLVKPFVDTENGDFVYNAGDYTPNAENGLAGETKLKPLVAVKITGNHTTATYDGAQHTASGFQITLPEGVNYKASDFEFKGTQTVTRTASGKTGMGLTASQFTNKNEKCDVTFVIVEDGYVEVLPADIKVLVTGNSDTVTYDGHEHTAKGYTVDEVIGQSCDLYDYSKNLVSTSELELTGTDAGSYTKYKTEMFFINNDLNYNVSVDFTPGTLTIKPAPVTVTVTGNRAEAVFDAQEHSMEGGYRFTIDNLLYGTKSIDVSFVGKEVKGINAGTYAMGLTVGQFKNLNGNFDVKFVVIDGALVIKPRPVNVIVVGAQLTTGYTGDLQSVVGIQNVVSEYEHYSLDQLEFTGTAVASRTDVGTTYMGIKPEDFINHDPNFVVTVDVKDGFYKVTPKIVEVKAINAWKYVGDPDPVFEYTVNDENVPLRGSLSRKPGEALGTYKLLQGTLESASPNYKVYFMPGIFEIKDPGAEIIPADRFSFEIRMDDGIDWVNFNPMNWRSIKTLLTREESLKAIDLYIKIKGILEGKNIDPSKDLTDTQKQLVSNILKSIDAPAKILYAATTILTLKVGDLPDREVKEFLEEGLSGIINTKKYNGKLNGRFMLLVLNEGGVTAFTEVDENGRLPFSMDRPSTLLLVYIPKVLQLATLKTSGKNALRLDWAAVEGAEGYDVFFTTCGSDTYKLAATVTDGYSYKFRKLNRHSCYKAYVRAWRTENGVKTYIGDGSPRLHAITGGFTRLTTNPKRVTVKKRSLSLKVGGKAKLGAKVEGLKHGRKLLKHVDLLRYYSSNELVAAVDAKGNITAMGVGTCTVYAVANNGVRKAVKVKVTEKSVGKKKKKRK